MALKNFFSGRNRHTEQTYGHMDTVEERREKGRCMQRVTQKFTIPYVK